MEDVMGNCNEVLVSYYEKMWQCGGGCFFVCLNGVDMIDDLYDSCLNFIEVIDDFKKYIVLFVVGNELMSFMFILLFGELGIGKMYFVCELVGKLGIGYEFILMSLLIVGWILLGVLFQWSNVKFGKVVYILVYGDFVNFIVVFDEVDKVGGDLCYDLMGLLYSLFEKDMVWVFKDEFIDIDIDVLYIFWVIIVNDECLILELIFNWMNVYEVLCLDYDVVISIVVVLYCEIVSQYDWGFLLEVDEVVFECFGLLLLCDMKKCLMVVFGMVKLEG